MLLFILGASAAFTAIQGGAYGTIRPRVQPFRAPPAGIWVNAQALPAGLPVIGCWLLAREVSGDVVWLAGGAIAAGGYVLLTAAQATLLTRA